jgi:hypothetical protein
MKTLIEVVCFVASNGVRQTIKDAVMRQTERPMLEQCRRFELFVGQELGAPAMTRLVEKFYEGESSNP